MQPLNSYLAKLLRRLWADPIWWSSLLVFAIYLGCVALRPTGVFWSLDEGGKFIYLQNVLRTHSIRGALAYPGQELDPALNAVPLYFHIRLGQQLYSWWPAAFSLLSLPFYWLFGWLGLYILPASAGALCAGCTGLLVRQLYPTQRWLACASVFITALTTPIWYYSTMFWEHTLSALLFTSAVWSILLGWQTGKVRWLVGSSILASGATFIRTESVGFVGGLILALLLYRWRWSIWFSLSYVLVSVPWLLFNQWAMNHFISRQWGQGSLTVNMSLFTAISQTGLWTVPYWLFNSPRVAAFDLGAWPLSLAMLLTIAVITLSWSKRWQRLAFIAHAGLAGICGWVLLQVEGYRSVHGFILIAPQVVFATRLHSTRPRDLRALFSTITLGAFTAYGIIYLTRGWEAAGGLQWGPRYMLPLYPLLIVTSLSGVAIWRERLKFFGCWSLVGLYMLSVLIGFGYEVRGLMAAGDTLRYYAQTHEALKPLQSEVIITDCSWLTMVIPDLYWTGRVFPLYGQQPKELANTLSLANYTRVLQVQVDLCSVTPLNIIATQRATNPTGLTIVEYPLH